MKAKQPQFIKLTRDALERMRRLDIRTRRFIDFLMEEHMRHGGMANGHLLAPYRQLVAHGISMGAIPRSIKRAESSGLVEASRGGMRIPTLYTLTWLPVADERRPPPRRKVSKRGRSQTEKTSKIHETST